jgi:hypothetical protein
MSRWLARFRHPPAHAPVVFRWDLDKTYLKSEFDSWRELVRIPFETAEEKVALPGVVPLIRGLRQFARSNGADARVYFLSASPPQIGKAIKAKLALDGIEYDGIVFKDQLHRIVRGKFRQLREHVGFKLTENLKSRRSMPPNSHEILFGDDWESDPLIYSLYADILAGRLGNNELTELLGAVGVEPPLIDEARALVGDIEPKEVVQRIYINLERRTPPDHFRAFGPRVVPTFNYFQTAACLCGDGHLSLSSVAEVAQSLIDDASYDARRLANSLDDIVRREHLQRASASEIRSELARVGILPPTRPRRRWLALRQALRRWWRARRARASTPSAPIDYRTLVANRREAH